MLPNASDDFKRLNSGYFKQQRQQAKTVSERWIQEQCEKLLEQHGFWRRSQARIKQGCPPAGWYVHLAQAPGNPILLDLLILHNDGTYLEIELKRASGKLTTHQKALLDHNEPCFVCYGVNEFWKTLNSWEVAKGE